MASFGREGSEIPQALAERYDRVHGSFSHEGGFEREARVERVLAGLGFESHTLSQGDILALTASTHDVLWAVEGRNTSSPATGPYLGDNFSITANTPPGCDAGGPYQVECQGPGTTIAMNATATDQDPIDQNNLTAARAALARFKSRWDGNPAALQDYAEELERYLSSHGGGESNG